jgi:hypothetical protein
MQRVALSAEMKRDEARRLGCEEKSEDELIQSVFAHFVFARRMNLKSVHSVSNLSRFDKIS